MPETAIDPQCEQPVGKAEIARANGALSNGPVSAEGKARSALNATRHGLCARTMVLGEGEDAGELAALRAALLARWQPVDAAEAHLVEELVFAAWRQVRLRAVEDAVLARAERGEVPSPALPSLATLMRYRGRIERDGRQASRAARGPAPRPQGARRPDAAALARRADRAGRKPSPPPARRPPANHRRPGTGTDDQSTSARTNPPAQTARTNCRRA